MLTRRGMVVAGLIGIFLISLVVGCGPKPPCPVGPTVVKEAQQKTAEVKAELQKAKSEREKLEQELSKKEAELESLKGKPQILREKLDALKKGSGR